MISLFCINQVSATGWEAFALLYKAFKTDRIDYFPGL